MWSRLTLQAHAAFPEHPGAQATCGLSGIGDGVPDWVTIQRNGFGAPTTQGVSVRSCPLTDLFCLILSPPVGALST